MRASTARAAHGLARWLVLLLLVFDQFSTPWHTHHHDSAVDGTVVAALHAGGHPSEVLAESHAEAPDHRSTWAHATTVLRSKVGPSLPLAGGGVRVHRACKPLAKLGGRSGGIKPHRVELVKLSNDPRFVEKLEDTVGL